MKEELKEKLLSISNDMELYLSDYNSEREAVLHSLIQFNFDGIKGLNVTINKDGNGYVSFDEGSADEKEVSSYLLNLFNFIPTNIITPNNTLKITLNQ